MASISFSIRSAPILPPKFATAASYSRAQSQICRCSLSFMPNFGAGRLVCTFHNDSCNRSRKLKKQMVVCMAPDEEKLTRRSPLDFPIGWDMKSGVLDNELYRALRRCMGVNHALQEWERPKPGRRPDIFPQFSPMKTPIPPPLPYDPPEEDEEEEEEKKKEEEEEPEKEEEPDNPEKQ